VHGFGGRGWLRRGVDVRAPEVWRFQLAGGRRFAIDGVAGGPGGRRCLVAGAGSVQTRPGLRIQTQNQWLAGAGARRPYCGESSDSGAEEAARAPATESAGERETGGTHSRMRALLGWRSFDDAVPQADREGGWQRCSRNGRDAGCPTKRSTRRLYVQARGNMRAEVDAKVAMPIRAGPPKAAVEGHRGDPGQRKTVDRWNAISTGPAEANDRGVPGHWRVIPIGARNASRR